MLLHVINIPSIAPHSTHAVPQLPQSRGDHFSTVANAIDGAQVMNLVEKDFEKYPSVESIRKAYHGLQFWFNDIGSGEEENELKILTSNKATG